MVDAISWTPDVRQAMRQCIRMRQVVIRRDENAALRAEVKNTDCSFAPE